MSQESRILQYLASGGSLTQMEALHMFGCFRLSGRIHRLRSQGHDIRTRNVTENGKEFARYYLPEKECPTKEECLKSKHEYPLDGCTICVPIATTHGQTSREPVDAVALLARMFQPVPAGRSLPAAAVGNYRIMLDPGNPDIEVREAAQGEGRGE